MSDEKVHDSDVARSDDAGAERQPDLARPTGLKGFWYMTGSFLWSRQFSALVALQIDAVEKGLNEKYWEE